MESPGELVRQRRGPRHGLRGGAALAMGTALLAAAGCGGGDRDRQPSPAPASGCRTDLVLRHDGAVASVTDHAAADAYAEGSYLYVMAADYPLDRRVVLATRPTEAGEQRVGLVLRGRQSQPFRTGDVIPHERGRPNFTLVAEVDGVFLPGAARVEPEATVEVVSVEDRRLCLAVEYSSAGVSVTGTVDAVLRPAWVPDSR